MTLEVARTGQERTIKEAMDYLARLGIPNTLIKRLVITSGPNEATVITAEIYVDSER